MTSPHAYYFSFPKTADKVVANKAAKRYHSTFFSPDVVKLEACEYFFQDNFTACLVIITIHGVKHIGHGIAKRSNRDSLVPEIGMNVALTRAMRKAISNAEDYIKGSC